MFQHDLFEDMEDRSSDDRSSDEVNYEAQAERIRARCTPAEKPAFRTKRILTEGVPFCSHPLYLDHPQDLGTWTLDRYFSGWRSFSLRGDPERICEKYVASLDTDKLLRPGSVRTTPEGKLEVEPGVRRVPALTEKQIAEGLHYFQFLVGDYCWYASSALPNFYPECVAPFFRKKIETPIEWASKRMAVVGGFCVCLTGKDYNFPFAEKGYERMAQLACNSLPAALLPLRSYTLTEERRTLFEEGRTALGDAFCPETAIFLMENSDCLLPADLRDPAALRFLKSLPRCLENGLVIDRVSELFRELLNDSPRAAALSRAASLAAAIYNGEERPWWFKEDFDLRPTTGRGSLSHEERGLLAQDAGFAFQYAEPLWRRFHSEFKEFPQLSPKTLAKFIAQVAREYGIGNLSRAANVLQYAVEMLREAEPEGRQATLAGLSETLSIWKPASEITGVLEGSEVNFSKPGLPSLLAALAGTQRLERDKIDALTIKPKHLRVIARQVSRPLKDRAKIRPALEAHIQTRHLLTDQSDTHALALPLSEEVQKCTALANPLAGWLGFERRLREECRCGPLSEVARIYFTFCAHKMPEPLSPPPGFLRIIEKFKEIPVPEYRHLILEAPERPAGISEKNAQAIANRYSMLSNLLDTWIIGAISWEELQKILGWITEDLPQSKRKEIEVNFCWRDKEDRELLPYRIARNVAEEVAEIEGEMRKLSRALAWATHDKDQWRIGYCNEELGKLSKKRGKFLAGQDPHREDEDDEPHQDLERQEEREWRRFMEEVGFEMRKCAEKVQLGRLQSAERAIGSIFSLNSLVIAGILAPARLRPLVAALFQELTPDKNESGENESGENEEQESFEGEQEKSFPISLHQMHGLQLINSVRIEEAIVGAKGPEDLKRVLSEVRRGVRMFENIRQEIESDASSICNYSPNGIAANAKTVSENLRLHVRRMLENDPIFLPDAAEKILRLFSWMDRYLEVFPHVEEFKGRMRGAFSPQFGLSPEARAVQSVNDTLLNVWFVLRALQINDHERLEGSKSPAALLEGAKKNAAEAADPPTQLAKPSSYHAIDSELGDVKERIAAMRREAFGLLPIGGKIHVLHKMDEGRLEFLKAQLGFSSTYFRLLHANNSLNLPAMPSSGELKIAIRLMDAEQIVDRDHPELQFCIPGRLSPEDCAVLGASILLSTEEGVKYNQDAFATTHDTDTGFRIMAYDKEGPRTPFPIDTKIRGRTDMFGRRHLNDLDRYQLLGTVLMNSMTGGPFSRLAEPYRDEFRRILKRNHLEKVLTRSWVRVDSTIPLSSSEGWDHYRHAIRPCTDAWFKCAAKFKRTGKITGVVEEVQKLFDWLGKEIRLDQEKMLVDEEYRLQREILLGEKAVPQELQEHRKEHGGKHV